MPWSRSKRSSCPGGTGKFGFNTYNLMAFMLMSFNQVNTYKYLHISKKQTKHNCEYCNDQIRWAMWSWTATTTGTTTTTTTSKQRLVLWTQTHRRRRRPRWAPPWQWLLFRLLGFQLSFLLVGGWLRNWQHYFVDKIQAPTRWLCFTGPRCWGKVSVESTLLTRFSSLHNCCFLFRGVEWDSPFWTVTDSGLIFYKGNSSTKVHLSSNHHNTDLFLHI